MKFIVSKKAFEVAVKNLCRVINTKNSLPILGDILCEVDEKMNTLHMTASDSEIWLSCFVGLDSTEGGGRFCVPAAQLADALSGLSEQPLTITATAESDMMFTLEHATGQVHFPIENADEYPTSPEMEDNAVVTMLAKDLQKAITTVSFATANDTNRPVMEGAEFNFMKTVADVVASDGHILMMYRFLRSYGCVGSFIMPKKVARIVPSMLMPNNDDEVSVVWNERQGSIEHENWVLTFRLIEGRYPKYESIIPKDSPWYCNVDTEQLMNAVKNVHPFANTSSSMIVANFEADKLSVSADDYDFQSGAIDSIQADSNVQEPLSIGLKSTSIISILSKIPYPTVTIQMEAPSRAVVFVEHKKEDNPKETVKVVALSMPMLLNE